MKLRILLILTLYAGSQGTLLAMRTVKDLIGALNKKDERTAQQILRSNPHVVNEKEPRVGNTALHAAVKNGMLSFAQELLEAGASVNLANNHGEEPLHVAARKADDRFVSLLVAYGGNMQAPNIRGETPELLLQGASFDRANPASMISSRAIPRGHAKPRSSVDELDHETQKKFWGTINAVKKGDYERFSLNLEKYPSFVGLSDSRQKTLLTHAAENGQAAMVKLLLTQGAEVNHTDKRMSTPLQYAIVYQHDEVIKLLQQHHGIIYAHCVIMLYPDWAYREWNLDCAFGRVKYNYIPEDVREHLQWTKTPPHITLAYVSIPMAYDIREGAEYLRRAKEYLAQIRGVAEAMGLTDKVIALLQRDPFRWDEVKFISTFLAVSYTPPRGYNKLIESFYQAVMREIPGAEKTYKNFEKPHISMAKILPGSGLTADAPVNQPVPKGTPQEMFNDLSTVNVEFSVRIPSRKSTNKHYGYSAHKNKEQAMLGYGK